MRRSILHACHESLSITSLAGLRFILKPVRFLKMCYRILMLSSQELEYLKGLNIGILGFGAQGRAEAMNLRKSGLQFKIGLRDGPSKDLALKEAFEVCSISDCVQSSDILLFNMPDQVQAEIYDKFIRGSRSPRYLVFAHGFSVHFGRIQMESDGPDHVLIAPKGAASGLEKFYGTPDALPGILAYQSPRHHELQTQDKFMIETLAKAIGCHPRALFWSSFKDECVCDLFSEQVLLCGGVSALIRRAYEVLVEAGYNPETAYFETIFELKLIVDLLWKEGISGMRSRISPTARFGDVTRGDRVIDGRVKEEMKRILSEIESGQFTKEFLTEIESPDYLRKLEDQKNHPIEKIGSELRKRLQSF